jgi:hypothetical protein
MLRRQGEKGAAALAQISRELMAPCLEAGEEVMLDVDAAVSAGTEKIPLKDPWAPEP